jgi:hypothetical protein
MDVKPEKRLVPPPYTKEEYAVSVRSAILRQVGDTAVQAADIGSFGRLLQIGT